MESEQSNNKCITKCFKEDINEVYSYFNHPFMGLYSIYNDGRSYCINQHYNGHVSLITSCNSSTQIDQNILHAFNIPIEPSSYLKLYFGLDSMNDIVKYIKDGKSVTFSSKSRIVDLALITYKDSFDNDIDKWIDIIRYVYIDMQNDISEDIIIKIFKKIFKKEEVTENTYPFNFLTKVKKYLDHNLQK